MDEGGGQAFGEVFDEVGGLGAGGGTAVEAVDFVNEDELDTSGGVVVADGVSGLVWVMRVVGMPR